MMNGHRHPDPYRECIACGLPLVRVREGGAEFWAHDATIGQALARSLALGVPAVHNVRRRTRAMDDYMEVEAIG